MDSWAEANSYDDYMGRWSRPTAVGFLEWLDAEPSRRWLDVGCGTGALAETIALRAAPSRLVGVDPSDGFIAAAAESLSDVAEFRVAGAEDLPFGDDEFDIAVSGLALNFVPDVGRALSEMRRVVTPGGIVAAYVWDYAGGMQMISAFWDAAATLDPEAGPLDEAARFPVCRPEPLRAAFAGSGLTSVQVGAIEIDTVFADFDAYWKPFLGGVGPAPGYVASLDDEHRQRLAELLRSRLAPSGHGALALTARAWAARGRA